MHSKKSKKKKDSDSESVSSSSTDTTPEPKCPLRFLMAGMMEAEAEGTEHPKRGCPLRRVQLWHVIPLCLLAIINLLLVIVALLGLAGYRISIGLQKVLVGIAKVDVDCNPFAESFAAIEYGTGLEVVGK